MNMHKFDRVFFIFLGFCLGLLIAFPISSIYTQTYCKGEIDLIQIKNTLHHYLENDLSNTDRINFRESDSVYLPSSVLSSTQDYHNSQTTQVKRYYLDTNKNVKKTLSHRKLVFRTFRQDQIQEEEKSLRVLNLLYEPSYDKGWGQYRLFLDVLKSSIRSQLKNDEEFYHAVIVPYSSASQNFRDYLLVKHAKITETLIPVYHKSFFSSKLNYQTHLNIGNSPQNSRVVLIADISIIHSRPNNQITLSIDLHTPQGLLIKNIKLHDMETFIKHSDMEYSTLYNQ
jgi:hypothetical protein